MFRLPGNFVRKRADSEPIDDSTVLFWTDILLVCVLGLFIIVAIPRAVARFSRGSEWWKGFLVGYSKIMDDGASSITRINGAMSEKKSTVVVPPTHVQALPTRFFSLGCFLRSEIIPDFHVARTLLMLLYFGVLLFAALYKGSIFKSSPRDGVLVASQLPWVYILATKNNAIGTLIGYGYEKLNVFHRWAGTLTILAANIHALGFIYSWVMQGIWTARLQNPTFRWGLVALVSIDLLFLSSLSYIRHHYYNLFFYTHSTAMIVLLVAVPIHQPFAIPYIAIAAAFYGADRVLRVIKSRMTVAYLQTIPDLGTTLVTMPRASGGWRAGQHIRIRVLKGDMILETHPFTIACACEGQKDGLIGIGGADGMILMVKKAGDWTRKLYDLAAQADMEGSGDAESSVMGRGTRVKVLVDGPYGGPGYTLYDSFSGVLLSAGGSGISFVLAIAQELLQRATVAPGSTNTRTIEIVWSIQHPRALSPLIPLFIRMLELSRDSDITLKIRVSYTRALLPDDERHFAQNLHKDVLPEGLSLTAGRVHMGRVLSEFADRTSSSLTASGAKGHGIALAVCGPASLGKDVASAMATLGAEDRNAVGGVEFYEEAFHW